MREVSTKSSQAKQGISPVSKADYLSTIGWIVGAIASIFLLGFIFGIALFLLLYVKLHGEKWLTSAILSFVVAGLFYVFFEVLLKMPFPHGLLLGWIM